MNELFDAIKTLFRSEISEVDLYNTLADSDADFPYVVVSIIPGVPDENAFPDGERSESGIVQFNIYSEDPTIDEIMDIRISIHTAFDYTTQLSVTGYSVTKFKREIGNILKEENKGKQVWSVMTQYSFEIEEN